MATHTRGPWAYVASTEHHGPYVAGDAGDVCDCYTMSNPMAASIRNGGDSYPIPFQGDEADANARLIAAAPEMLEALRWAVVLITSHVKPEKCIHINGEMKSAKEIFALASDARAKAVSE